MSSTTEMIKAEYYAKITEGFKNVCLDIEGQFRVTDVVQNPDGTTLVQIHYGVDLKDEERIIRETNPGDFIRSVRGMIYEFSLSDEPKLMVRGGAYYPTVIADDFAKFIADLKAGTVKDTDGHSVKLPEGTNNNTTHPLYEGVSIYVWYYKGQVMLSTHRKIDISESLSYFGGSKAFVHLFRAACKGYWESYIERFSQEGKVMHFILSDEQLLQASKFKHHPDAPTVAIRIGYKWSDATFAPPTAAKAMIAAIKEHKCSPPMKHESMPGVSSETFHGTPVSLKKDEATEYLKEGEAVIFICNGRPIRVVSSEFKKREDMLKKYGNVKVENLLVDVSNKGRLYDTTTFFEEFECTEEQIAAMTLPVGASNEVKNSIFKLRQQYAMNFYIEALPPAKARAATAAVPKVVAAYDKLIEKLVEHHKLFLEKDPLRALEDAGVMTKNQIKKDSGHIMTYKALLQNNYKAATDHKPTAAQVAKKLRTNISNGVMSKYNSKLIYPAFRMFGLLKEGTA